MKIEDKLSENNKKKLEKKMEMHKFKKKIV